MSPGKFGEIHNPKTFGQKNIWLSQFSSWCWFPHGWSHTDDTRWVFSISTCTPLTNVWNFYLSQKCYLFQKCYPSQKIIFPKIPTFLRDWWQLNLEQLTPHYSTDNWYCPTEPMTMTATYQNQLLRKCHWKNWVYVARKTKAHTGDSTGGVWLRWG